MTFKTCERVIEAKRGKLAGVEWTNFIDDMANKLDVFLLNDRITDEQYNTLVAMMQ